MSITKTLGGDRLGAGKRMKVELHGYERSTHNMGYLWRSTMSAGTLVPFMSEIALPGDTFDIDLDCDIKTHPTIGPLFGSYKTQLDIFLAPIRLYQGQLHNNKLGIGMNMANVKLPLIQLRALSAATDGPDWTTTAIDNVQINPSNLLAYLGLRGVGYNDGVSNIGAGRDFNAVPILAYWDIYKNYYANKQEEIGAVIHAEHIANEPVTMVEFRSTTYGTDTIPLAPAGSVYLLQDAANIEISYPGPGIPDPSTVIFNTSIGQISAQQLSINGFPTGGVGIIVGTYNIGQYGSIQIYSYELQTTGTTTAKAPIVTTFQLSNIDDMREYILTKADDGPIPVYLHGLQVAPYTYLDEYDALTYEWSSLTNTQEGLGLKTYQSDLFNNWLSTEWIDGVGGINDITAIDTSGGSFNIDTLNLSKKVYDMLNRIAVSGGSYDDWLDAVYATERRTRTESPVYQGGLSKELVFQEVISNSNSAGTGEGGQPLGTLAGRGVMSKKHKGGSVIVRVDEPSYIIGIVSLTPRVDYSQGNKWDLHLKTMDDLHKPALDEIGFQELITEQMAWWETHWTLADGWTQRSAGKQPAWINYMTNVNRVLGNFAIPDNEMFMTLNRRYELDPVDFRIQDLTTYIDPVKFNNIFAQTSIDAQNFWAQIAVDITARRKMSAKLMPNL